MLVHSLCNFIFITPSLTAAFANTFYVRNKHYVLTAQRRRKISNAWNAPPQKCTIKVFFFFFWFIAFNKSTAKKGSRIEMIMYVIIIIYVHIYNSTEWWRMAFPYNASTAHAHSISMLMLIFSFSYFLYLFLIDWLGRFLSTYPMDP